MYYNKNLGSLAENIVDKRLNNQLILNYSSTIAPLANDILPDNIELFRIFSIPINRREFYIRSVSYSVSPVFSYIQGAAVTGLCGNNTRWVQPINNRNLMVAVTRHPYNIVNTDDGTGFDNQVTTLLNAQAEHNLMPIRNVPDHNDINIALYQRVTSELQENYITVGYSDLFGSTWDADEYEATLLNNATIYDATVTAVNLSLLRFNIRLLLEF